MDDQILKYIKDESIPESLRQTIAERAFIEKETIEAHKIEKEKLEFEKSKSRLNTPIVVMFTGLVTLGATHIFNVFTARTESGLAVQEVEVTAKNEVTLEQIKAEISESETRLEQSFQERLNYSEAEIEALAKEREFQYEIVQKELTDKSKNNAERAATLLFLVRAGILSTLDKKELISMILEQQNNPDELIIPSLAGTIEQKIDTAKNQIEKLEKELLSVPNEIVSTYNSYLKNSGYGLIRLLPRGRYEDAMLINGGGAYYSFVRRTHEYGYGSDIELQREYISVGFAGVDYGFFLDIGDVDISFFDAISAVPPDWVEEGIHDAWRHMFSYVPPKLLAEGRREQGRYGDGVDISDRVLIDRLKYKISNSYLLRSINESNSDVLVVFRIVEKLSDSSLVLVWRLLESFPVVDMTGPDLQD